MSTVTEASKKLKLYELINPSDPYTFYAESLQVAGLVACTLSHCFGAREIESGEQTPILIGWKLWFDSWGVDDVWIKANASQIADAFDSFLIGSCSDRKLIEETLAELPEDARKRFIERRQERNRSSLNRIGEAAYEYGKQFRKFAESLKEEGHA